MSEHTPTSQSNGIADWLSTTQDLGTTSAEHNDVTPINSIALTNASADDVGINLMPRFAPLISDAAIRLVGLLGFGVVCQILAVLGCVFNVINMAVFATLRMDVINISFFGLSLSDFASCFFLVFNNISKSPWFYSIPGLPFVVRDVAVLFFFFPHRLFIGVSYCITAFIAVQRCLCVVFPMRVRLIFTPKRVSLITAAVFIIHILMFAPIYTQRRLEGVLVSTPSGNRTIYAIGKPSPGSRVLNSILIPISGLFLPALFFSATATASAILAYKLRQKAAWKIGIGVAVLPNPRGRGNSASTVTAASVGSGHTASTFAEGNEGTKMEEQSTSVHGKRDMNVNNKSTFAEGNVGKKTEKWSTFAEGNKKIDAGQKSTFPGLAMSGQADDASNCNRRDQGSSKGQGQNESGPPGAVEIDRSGPVTGNQLKELKVAKLVLVTSAVFIACGVPFLGSELALTVYSSMQQYARYENVKDIMMLICNIVTTINACANIFVYYHMNSKFRKAFKTMLKIK